MAKIALLPLLLSFLFAACRNQAPPSESRQDDTAQARQKIQEIRALNTVQQTAIGEAASMEATLSLIDSLRSRVGPAYASELAGYREEAVALLERERLLLDQLSLGLQQTEELDRLMEQRQAQPLTVVDQLSQLQPSIREAVDNLPEVEKAFDDIEGKVRDIARRSAGQ